jgi:predicted RNase H-like HicB family nuclease
MSLKEEKKTQMTKDIDKVMKIEIIFEASDEGGYTVHVPTFPGCISEGNTFKEALENIFKAIELYIENISK